MKKIDIFTVRQTQKYKSIVNYVWRQRGAATRMNVARDLNLSNATVYPAIEYLMKTGILDASVIKVAKPGRNPDGLRIAAGQCFAIGVHIRYTMAEICFLDVAQQIICQQTLTGLSSEGAEILKCVLEAMHAMARQYKMNWARLVGVGVVLPGFIDHKAGVARQSPAFKSHVQLPISAFFERELKKPCMALSTAPTLALAEKEWGKAANISNFLYLAGNGTGLGMFINNRLFMGYQSYGGEIGFMKFDSGQIADADGRTGTFHHANPFRRMVSNFEEAIYQGAETVVAKYLQEGCPLSIELIVEAAVQGDTLARNFIEEGFRVFAEMIVSLNYLLNPEAVFLPPWTAQCPDITLDVVKRRLELCSIINPDSRVQVLAAKYGKQDLTKGVAMLPLNQFFEM